MYFQTEYQRKGYALSPAAAKGEVDNVRRLLAEDADVHFHIDLPVRAAAFTGNFETLKVLVEEGAADIHANKEEALMNAAKRGDADMTRYLLSKGADVATMKEHHAHELDGICLATLDAVLSEKPAEAFKENFSALKGNLRNKPRL